MSNQENLIKGVKVNNDIYKIDYESLANLPFGEKVDKIIWECHNLPVVESNYNEGRTEVVENTNLSEYCDFDLSFDDVNQAEFCYIINDDTNEILTLSNKLFHDDYGGSYLYFYSNDENAIMICIRRELIGYPSSVSSYMTFSNIPWENYNTFSIQLCKKETYGFDEKVLPKELQLNDLKYQQVFKHQVDVEDETTWKVVLNDICSSLFSANNFPGSGMLSELKIDVTHNNETISFYCQFDHPSSGFNFVDIETQDTVLGFSWNSSEQCYDLDSDIFTDDSTGVFDFIISIIFPGSVDTSKLVTYYENARPSAPRFLLDIIHEQDVAIEAIRSYLITKDSSAANLPGVYSSPFTNTPQSWEDNN